MTVLPIVVLPIVVTPPTVVSSLPDSPAVSVWVGLANAEIEPCLFVDATEEDNSPATFDFDFFSI